MILRPDPGHSHVGAGFTLIEILVVLAIVTLAIALIAGRGQLGSRTLSAEAAAVQMATDLRAARAQAILHNRPVAVTIDLDRRVWTAGDGTKRRFPRATEIRITTVAGETRAKTAAISFQPDGSCTGGSVVLVDGARQWRIGIDWLSSRVSVSDAR